MTGLFPHQQIAGTMHGPLVSFRTLKSGLTKADSEIGRVMANVADLEAKIEETSTTSSRCLRRRGPHARGGVAEPFAGAGGSTDRLARARRGVDQLLGISVIQNGACGRDMPCGRSWSAGRSSSAPRSSTARAQWQGAARCPWAGSALRTLACAQGDTRRTAPASEAAACVRPPPDSRALASAARQRRSSASRPV